MANFVLVHGSFHGPWCWDDVAEKLPAAMAPEIFYNRCTSAQAAWASARLRPQPTAVYATPLALACIDAPRYYIACEDDRAVSVLYQRQMLENSPCDKIYNLDTDHSPFLSAQVPLLDILNEVIEQA